MSGAYEKHSEHHGRPAYKKHGQDVFLYYWQGEEDPELSGWWLGPQFAGDSVMAFHTDTHASIPPSNGWRLPPDRPMPTADMQIKYECTYVVSPGANCREKPPISCSRGMCNAHCRLFGDDCPRHNSKWQQEQNEKKRKDRARRRAGGKRQKG